MSFARPKALIIANCQVQPLKHALSARAKDIDFEEFGVHLAAPQDMAERIERLAARKSDFKFVLSFSLSDDYGIISKNMIEQTFYPARVIFITNIYFSGLHPDLTYIGGIGVRLSGPTGDYHSRIAAIGYASGLGADHITDLYTHKTYEKLDYYMEFQRSIAELKSRDERVDIKLSDKIEDVVRSGGLFYSMNHPSSSVTEGYADDIAQWLSDAGLIELVGWNAGAASAPNYLALSEVMPVFPEICRAHHLPYPGSYLFKRVTIGDEPGRILNLREFVELELEAFRQVSPEVIACTFPMNVMLEKYGNPGSW